MKDKPFIAFHKEGFVISVVRNEKKKEIYSVMFPKQIQHQKG